MQHLADISIIAFIALHYFFHLCYNYCFHVSSPLPGNFLEKKMILFMFLTTQAYHTIKI